MKQVNSEESASRRLLLLAQAASRGGIPHRALLNNFDSIIVGKRLSQAQLNELRPTTELALVIGSKQPLNDIDVEMTSSPCLMYYARSTSGYLSRKPQEHGSPLYQEDFPFLSDELLDPLLVITGRHPFLLAMVTRNAAGNSKDGTRRSATGNDRFPLIELRLQSNGRLRRSLAKALKNPPQRIPANAVDKLLKLIIDAPIAPQAMDPGDQPSAELVYQSGHGALRGWDVPVVHPLFANFLRHQTGDGAPAFSRRCLLSSSPPIDSFCSLTAHRTRRLLYLRARTATGWSPTRVAGKRLWKLPASTSERRAQEAIRRLRKPPERRAAATWLHRQRARWRGIASSRSRSKEFHLTLSEWSRH